MCICSESGEKMVELSELLKPPNKEQCVIIRKALKEDENRLLTNIKLLENWITYQKHLPQNYDRRLLYAYTRGCKHDMEKAKKKIELFFAVKSSQHDFYTDRKISIEGILSATKFAMMVTLPEYSPEGYRITVFKITSSDVELFDLKKVIRFGLMTGDFRAHADNLVGGEILIFDQGECTAAITAKAVTTTLKRAIQITQDVYPSLIKQIHIITDRVFIEKLINAVKYFVKEKLKKRIHVHRSYDTLTKFIPIKYLPADYGGSQRSLDDLNERWKELFIQEKQFFDELDKVKMRGDIPKKLVESFTDENDFGLEGSFRRLNID